MRSAFFTVALLTSALVVALSTKVHTQSAGVVTLVERAVAERVGSDAMVIVALVGEVPAGSFVSAVPDPLGRLGREMNFTLSTAGTAAKTVRVRARVDVVVPRVQAKTPILRGHVVSADDVEIVAGPLVGVPVKRLPEMSQIVGQPALRPIDRGQVIESSFVAVRRVVQAGDTVTVVAMVGTVRVTAVFTAADSGDPGDVVRVVNHDTHRSLKARVLSKGMAEVINGQ